jgi:hypothetical protein
MWFEFQNSLFNMVDAVSVRRVSDIGAYNFEGVRIKFKNLPELEVHATSEKAQADALYEKIKKYLTAEKLV